MGELTPGEILVMENIWEVLGTMGAVGCAIWAVGLGVRRPSSVSARPLRPSAPSAIGADRRSSPAILRQRLAPTRKRRGLFRYWAGPGAAVAAGAATASAVTCARQARSGSR